MWPYFNVPLEGHIRFYCIWTQKRPWQWRRKSRSWLGTYHDVAGLNWCIRSKPFPFLVHLDQRSRWTIAITWRLSSVNFSHFKLLLRNHWGQLEPNLAWMFLGWSSTKLLFFVPVGYSTWLPGPIICSDWLKFQRSSSLKLRNWLNPNCKWMIIGMSFNKFLFFMPIGNPRWLPPRDVD